MIQKLDPVLRAYVNEYAKLNGLTPTAVLNDAVTMWWEIHGDARCRKLKRKTTKLAPVVTFPNKTSTERSLPDSTT